MLSSRPAPASVAHRRSVIQRVWAVAPTIANGLTRARVSASVARIKAHTARANPIAHAVYSRRGKSSRGTAIMHVPHC